MLGRQPAASGVSPPTFQIQVTVNGATTMLDASSDWTEDDVKAALNRPGDCHHYFVAGGGKPLNDGETTTLAALGVGQGGRLELRGRLLGGMGCGASKEVAAENTAAQWTALVDQWASDDGALPPSAEEAALTTAATACLDAAEQASCTHCGNRFAEQWGDAPWHCFECKNPIDPCRATPEAAAKAAAIAVDAPFVRREGDGLTAEGQERHAGRAVCVRWLLMLLALLPAAVRRTIFLYA